MAECRGKRVVDWRIWQCRPTGPARARRLAGDIDCLRCGYNLRGLTEPRCPECGYVNDRVADLAARAADAAGEPLPPAFWNWLGWWTALGVPAFFLFLALFWLMIAKPALAFGGA